MIDSELRVGVIGCGALGAIHAQRFSAIPGVRVTAVSDPDPASMERAIATLPGPITRVADHCDLIASGVDAVCIASPDGWHVRQVLDALGAGLHVLCEKPLTPDPQELATIIATVERTGLVMTMTYPRRHDRRLQQMREEIRSGRAGRVVAASLYHAEDWVRMNAGTWRHDPAMCPGGFIYDSIGHEIDTFFWLTEATARWVEAQTANHGTPSPMSAWGTSELVGGAPLTFQFVGVGFEWYEQVSIVCENGHFAINRGQPLWLRDGRMEAIDEDGPPQHADDNFVRLIRDCGVNWAPPSELWPVLHFTRATLQSAGRRVEVPHGPLPGLPGR